jgi:hypothetical protein
LFALTLALCNGISKVCCSDGYRESAHCVATWEGRSRLRKKINLALLSMSEDGTHQRIYDNWFRALRAVVRLCRRFP